MGSLGLRLSWLLFSDCLVLTAAARSTVFTGSAPPVRPATPAGKFEGQEVGAQNFPARATPSAWHGRQRSGQA